MVNTGWQICRCITSVSSYDNSKLLDRNGMECTLLDVDGVPVSAAGLKQAAKVLDVVDISTETPVGQSKTYSQLYDILGRYTVNTTGVPTSSFVYEDGVIVARYRGAAGQSCEVASANVFSSSPSSAVLSPKGASSASINFNITSTVNGVNRDWSIDAVPVGVSLLKNSSLLTITSFVRNLDTSNRVQEIYQTPARVLEVGLIQNGTAEVLSIPLTQGGIIIKRFQVLDIGDGRIIQLNAVTDSLINLINTSYRLVSMSDSVNGTNNSVNVPVVEVFESGGASYVRFALTLAPGATVDSMAFSIVD